MHPYPRLSDVPPYLRTTISVAIADAYRAAVAMRPSPPLTRAQPDPKAEKPEARKHRRAA